MIINDNSQSVLVLGPVPPPLGGVSVFLSRWIAKLRREGRRVGHINPSRLKVGSSDWYTFFGRYDEILINSLHPLAIVGAKVFHPLTPIVAVDHNASRFFANHKLLRRFAQFLALLLVKKIAVVSPHLRANYRWFGGKIEEASPFVAPDVTGRSRIEASYSSRTTDFLKPGTGPVLVISAWRPIDEGGQDLYGLADSLCLLERILTKWPNARLVVFVGEVIANRVWAKFCDKLETSGQSECISLEIGQKEMWPFLLRADVMLRLTPTDGNSVSIHEALWAGCGVVASDAVPRPLGVLTYRYGDMDDLETKVNSLLELNRDARGR